ncbi:MAG: hypothetical protein AAF394_04400 [Planctomycetota bacterium]
MNSQADDPKQSQDRWRFQLLLTLGVLQFACYLAIAFLSDYFRLGGDQSSRPIPLVLLLFTACFMMHLAALMLGLQVQAWRRLMKWIVLGAVCFRGVLLFSQPIQEVDIYRYCWDGAVFTKGVSPFRYSPMRVLLAQADEPGLSPELQRVIALRDRDEGLAKILERVHFGELTTIYPPTSQIVFALADWVTPAGASVTLRLWIMKTFIVAFDLLTLACLAKMLAMLRIHVAWAIPYAWSPLLIKEFANSGHLDSIAVFFTSAAVYCFLKAFVHDSTRTTMNVGWTLGSALLLAAGVGAKLYPIVLAPLFAWILLRQIGWRCSAIWCVSFGITTALALSPMLVEMRGEAPDARPTLVPLEAEAALTGEPDPTPGPADLFASESSFPPLPSSTGAVSGETSESVSTNDSEPLAPAQPPTATKPNDDGLVEFLSRWEMNDLLFMVVEENLRASFKSRPKPWFVFTSDKWRSSVAAIAEEKLGWKARKTPFFLTRTFSLAVFLILVAAFTLKTGRRIRRQESHELQMKAILEGVFLILAWFWLLSPTQNPWYWSWCLPFVVFASSRVWLAVSGLVMTYYLRFWFLYQYGETEVWALGYVGTDFFDFVVVWIEYAPWMAFLAVSWMWSRRRFY